MSLQQDLGLRDLDAASVPFAADLHRRSLPDGFFCRLGPRFLRAYYTGFRTSPHATATLATVAGAPAGVLVGTLDNAAHHHWVLRTHGPALAALGTASLLARPALLATFLRTRAPRYARRLLRPPASTAQPVEQGPVAVLTHVAVTPEQRGTGLGTALVDHFVIAAAQAGAHTAALVTTDAGGFYERLGWHAVDRRPDRDGRLVTEYRLLLSGT